MEAERVYSSRGSVICIVLEQGKIRVRLVSQLKLNLLKDVHQVKCFRVFANGHEDRGSIPGRVISKTFKWYLIPPFLTLSDIRYV